MAAHSFDELKAHIGHSIVCVGYGVDGQEPDNVAIECETCNTVLMDFNWGDTAPGGLDGGYLSKDLNDSTWEALFYADDISETTIVISTVTTVGSIRTPKTDEERMLNPKGHPFFVVELASRSHRYFVYLTKDQAIQARNRLLVKIENFHAGKRSI